MSLLLKDSEYSVCYLLLVSSFGRKQVGNTWCVLLFMRFNKIQVERFSCI